LNQQGKTKMIKGINSIINDHMDNAAEVIAGKIEYKQIVLDQFEEKGDTARVAALKSDIEEMTLAMNVIKKHCGCWA
jgi:hypothetical protein